MAEEKKERKVTIDGKEYNFSDLSDDVKHQLLNIRLTDQEIERLNRQLSIAKTAKNAYTQALQQEIQKQESTQH